LILSPFRHYRLFDVAFRHFRSSLTIIRFFFFFCHARIRHSLFSRHATMRAYYDKMMSARHARAFATYARAMLMMLRLCAPTICYTPRVIALCLFMRLMPHLPITRAPAHNASCYDDIRCRPRYCHARWFMLLRGAYARPRARYARLLCALMPTRYYATMFAARVMRITFTSRRAAVQRRRSLLMLRAYYHDAVCCCLIVAIAYDATTSRYAACCAPAQHVAIRCAPLILC